jgi:ATP-dependent RNA helicase DeaD
MSKYSEVEEKEGLLFSDLPLIPEIQQALDDMGFSEPTPIQAAALPFLLDNRDVIGQAQTGTGKTGAFAIPALQNIDLSNKSVQVITICPTRELAIQVAKEFSKISKYQRGVKEVVIYGGDSITKQMDALRAKPQIVIGTPGRMIDHIKRRTLDLSNVKTVILDEADEMLNMGFKEDIEFILSQMPEERQTVFFSATMPKPIMELTKKYQTNPEIVRIASKELTNKTIEQTYYPVRVNQKLELMRRLIEKHQLKSMLVFCNTKIRCDEVSNALQQMNYSADTLHGDLSQAQRNVVMNKFRTGKVGVLVATDVAARGLDVPEVEAVFNFDTPLDPEYYVHRIGRTGRAGKSGLSFTFVVGKDIQKLRDIERYAKTSIPQGEVPSVKDIVAARQESFLNSFQGVMDENKFADYEPIAQELLAKGYEPQAIIAALIKKFTDLSLTEREQVNIELENPSERGGRRGDRERGDRDRGERSSRHGDRDRGDRKEGNKSFESRNSNMKRLVLNLGKDQKISKGDIVGAIAGELGIKGSAIGAIDLHDAHAFVDVDSRDVDRVIKEMKNRKIKGKKARFEVAN